MEMGEWVKSNVDYGKRLVGSGIEGARSGQEEFLNGEPLGPFLSDSVKASLPPAAIGACVGALAGYPFYRQKSSTATATLGVWPAGLRRRAHHGHGLEKPPSQRQCRQRRTEGDRQSARRAVAHQESHQLRIDFL